MKAETMRNLVDKKRIRKEKREKRKIAKRDRSAFAKIQYLYIIIRIRLKAQQGKTKLQINGGITHYAEVKLKKEGFSVFTSYARIGKVMYVVIGW